MNFLSKYQVSIVRKLHLLEHPTQENPQGGIMKKETSIHSSNVLYVENDSPVKIGYKFLDNGSKVRYSKKTNNIFCEVFFKLFTT